MRVPNVYVSPDNVVEIDLKLYFVKGEELTYTCTVADNSIATANVAGTTLTVKGLKVGTTTAVLRTSNGQEQTITVTVRKNAGNNGWM